MRAFFHKTLSFFSIVLLALAMTACSAGGTPEKVAEKFRGCIRLAQKIVKFHTIFAMF
ncbi:MAG: hypothetical protein J6V99_07210 [Neisseriaceae bacterium]|nr:hypothetical protein [Neisseriaceae bacterium]